MGVYLKKIKYFNHTQKKYGNTLGSPTQLCQLLALCGILIRQKK